MLSPSFSTDVYRKSNHDLNHMSDKQLRDHFSAHGWQEGRIYSNLPLRIKPWLEDFLTGRRAHKALKILESHLKALNIANGHTLVEFIHDSWPTSTSSACTRGRIYSSKTPFRANGGRYRVQRVDMEGVYAHCFSVVLSGHLPGLDPWK